MDAYVYNQCKNAIASVQLYQKACEMAFEKDGKITKQEQKLLKQINAAVTRFTTDIEKCIKKGEGR